MRLNHQENQMTPETSSVSQNPILFPLVAPESFMNQNIPHMPVNQAKIEMEAKKLSIVPKWIVIKISLTRLLYSFGQACKVVWQNYNKVNTFFLQIADPNVSV